MGEGSRAVWLWAPQAGEQGLGSPTREDILSTGAELRERKGQRGRKSDPRPQSHLLKERGRAGGEPSGRQEPKASRITDQSPVREGRGLAMSHTTQAGPGSRRLRQQKSGGLEPSPELQHTAGACFHSHRVGTRSLPATRQGSQVSRAARAQDAGGQARWRRAQSRQALVLQVGKPSPRHGPSARWGSSPLPLQGSLDCGKSPVLPPCALGSGQWCED